MFRFPVVKCAALACAWALFCSADGSAPARGSESAMDAPGWGAHTHRGWWNPDSPGRHPLTVLQDYDYIVVGSGPGGAPIAARLGLAGFRVLVIEAGHDAALTNYNVTVPYFNARASEDERLSWDFYVCGDEPCRGLTLLTMNPGEPLSRPCAQRPGQQVLIQATQRLHLPRAIATE